MLKSQSVYPEAEVLFEVEALYAAGVPFAAGALYVAGVPYAAGVREEAGVREGAGVQEEAEGRSQDCQSPSSCKITRASGPVKVTRTNKCCTPENSHASFSHSSVPSPVFYRMPLMLASNNFFQN